MKIFCTSDHHFFHTNIIKYCDRPFVDREEMNRAMIERWNEAIGPDDLVFQVGDMSAGLGDQKENFKELIGKLGGRKVLIRGNHDHQPDEWYLEAGFSKVVPWLNLSGVLLVHYSLEECVRRGMDLGAFGVVEHVIHGHTHALGPELDGHFNVAVDRNDFRPVCAERAVPEPLFGAFARSCALI